MEYKTQGAYKKYSSERYPEDNKRSYIPVTGQIINRRHRPGKRF